MGEVCVHSAGIVLLFYQLHLIFLSAPYPYVQIMVLGEMCGLLICVVHIQYRFF